MDEKKDYSLTDFSTIIVSKHSLLEKLRQNRNKHNEIYEASVSGYWLEASKILEKKKAEFEKAKYDLDKRFEFSYTNVQDKIDKMEKNFGSLEAPFYFNPSITLQYPVNHLDDYDRAISMLEFSLADKVELSDGNFRAFVMNDWTWKKEFLDTNHLYARTYLDNVCLVSGVSIYTTGSSFGQFAINKTF